MLSIDKVTNEDGERVADALIPAWSLDSTLEHAGAGWLVAVSHLGPRHGCDARHSLVRRLSADRGTAKNEAPGQQLAENKEQAH